MKTQEIEQLVNTVVENNSAGAFVAFFLAKDAWRSLNIRISKIYECTTKLQSDTYPQEAVLFHYKPRVLALLTYVQEHEDAVKLKLQTLKTELGPSLSFKLSAYLADVLMSMKTVKHPKVLHDQKTMEEIEATAQAGEALQEMLLSTETGYVLRDVLATQQEFDRIERTIEEITSK